jgi:hypothetical protein
MSKPKTLNIKVVRNDKVKLLPEGILKWSTVCEKLIKLVQKMLKKKHETEFEMLDEPHGNRITTSRRIFFM